MFRLHQSNRLDRLADRLAGELAASRRASLLQPIPVLVQNPGMKRWLQQRLADARGIAAGIDFPLPSRHVWALHQSLFGETEALEAWDESRLQWRLMRLIGEQADNPALRGLKPYLRGDNEALRRLQLAQKLASLFEQYQVYRPDMVDAWERGERLGLPSEGWQAELWQRLVREQPHPPHHRLLRQLLDRLQRDRDLPELGDVHVFALSSLSPSYLRLLMLLGRHVEVQVYHLSPCEHYWGDIQDRRQQHQGSLGEQLLASMGRQGREFLDAFYDLDPNVVDERDFVAIEGDHLLARVQRQILSLEAVEGPVRGTADDSLTIVSCYSEWRELQVLRDRLLGWLEDDPSLQPHDIVVMCPDIDRIAPIIQAVFDEAVDNRHIPYSISDQSRGRESLLLPVMLEWLELPRSRFTASEILGWLELPALQRRYELDEEDREQLRLWIREHHVHWGRDGGHKQQYGLEAHSLHSWRAAIDRLLASYLMDDSRLMLGDLPLSPIQPSQDDLRRLGQLKKLLDDLWQLREDFARPADLAEWQGRINRLVDRLLLPDEDEEWMLKGLRDQLDLWRQQAMQAGLDEALDSELLCLLLQQYLQQGSSGHRYLDGGITFCNLIPMRMLPFRVVCLLGMNESDFPRRDSQLRFDLMAQHRRPGDRSSRDDDRYLFLQALMSARDHFHVSYIGRDRRDDSPRQPSVLVSQLIDAIEQSEGLALPIRQAPLQAFDPANFDRAKGPSGGSFAEHWRVTRDQPQTPPSFFQERLPREEDEQPLIELATLLDFLRDPSRHYLRKRLGMGLQRDEFVVEDDEPFDSDALSRYGLRRDWLRADFAGQAQQRIEQWLLQQGRLPPGNLGCGLLHATRAEVEEILDGLREQDIEYMPQRIDLPPKPGGLPLTGSLRSDAATRWVKIDPASDGAHRKLMWWAEHCCMSLTDPQQMEIFCFSKKLVHYRLQPIEESLARDWLQACIESLRQVMVQPVALFPEAGWQYLELLKKGQSETAALDAARRQLLEEEDAGHGRFGSEWQALMLRHKQDLPEDFEDTTRELLQPVFAAFDAALQKGKRGGGQ